MRIVPVTGDLPALVTPPPPPVRSVGEPPPTAAPAPVAPVPAAGADAGTAAGDRHAPPSARPFFDPPLIAQRAVLGLPTGFLIADFARSEGLPYAAVAAAVDREMPPEVD